MNMFESLPSENDNTELAQELSHESQGWPGDGSGEDDLADHNANEADDYRYEGNEDPIQDHDDPIQDHNDPPEDQYLDASYEDRCECGE